MPAENAVMDESQKDADVRERAIARAKQRKKPFAKVFTDKAKYPTEANPVSVFMAGSPGAGKTEASKELLRETLQNTKVRVLRIDPDDLRGEFPDYDGTNAWLFQGAVSILVEKIHDLALEQAQSFILDGTLAIYDRAAKNIKRSLGRGRQVQILYVYQRPELAWEFVKARELK